MTKKRIYKPDEARIRDSRLTVLRSNLDFLAHHYPRCTVLYPLMDRVIYQDFETLIAGSIEDNDPVNDNDQ